MHLPPLPEMLVVLAIVVMLFGAGRVSKLGGELGVAIRDFRKGLSEDPNAPVTPNPPVMPSAPVMPNVTVTPTSKMTDTIDSTTPPINR